MEEAAGSIPASSTLRGTPLASLSDTFQCTGFSLGGVVAGEGCFSVTTHRKPYADGRPRPRFVFSLEMSACDHDLVAALHTFLQVGSVRSSPARRAGWQPSVTLTVNSLRAHLQATIPFADTFLPESAKRRQYLAWRHRLGSHLLERPLRWGLGRASCSSPGCAAPVRGQGLCRHHYYEATGH